MSIKMIVHLSWGVKRKLKCWLFHISFRRLSFFADVVAGFPGGFSSKEKALPVRRQLTQVKIFSPFLIDAENLQCCPTLRGRDALHGLTDLTVQDVEQIFRMCM